MWTPAKLAPMTTLRFSSICALSALAGLTLLTNACERQPAAEPAESYGHGSAKPGSRNYQSHSFDGKGKRYSDSEGTDIKPIAGTEKEKKD